MYIITDAKNVPAVPQVCRVGIPADTESNLAILNPGNPSNVIWINSTVLREALLADPSFVLFTLGLKVTDCKGVIK